MSALGFEILHRDSTSLARAGRVTTPHGSFDTPAFMPVGTQGTIKGLMPDDVAATGAQIVLGNTYHLLLRPGSELVARMGGLQAWSRWGGPMLTDSGGFQVFSLGHINRIDDHGVVFRSHLDGSRIDLTPEHSMRVQNELGADIIMAFDDCPPLGPKRRAPGVSEEEADTAEPVADSDQREPELEPAPEPTVDHADPLRLAQAVERTLVWLDRCVKSHARPQDQALFAIVQGGTDLELRSACAARVTQHDLPGFAIGGVAVGEGYDQMRQVVEHTAPLLPLEKPRYLMGVGYERDILMAVRAGVDMFDCVLPTRNGRNANAFTRQGPMRLRNARYVDDPLPIDPDCDCQACGGGFSRSYVRHLFMAGEMLGPILVSLHNLRHYQRLMLDIRAAIRDNDWSLFNLHWPVALG